MWKVEEESSFHVIMGLADNEATRAVWPHSFKISYTVRLLPRGISLHLKVTNKNETFPMTFSGCLHTYFKFDNALDVALSGFMNTTFIDKADNRREKVQDGPIFVEEESNRSAKDAGSKSKDGYGFVDRIHYESPNSFTFTERSSGKTLYRIGSGNRLKPSFKCIKRRTFHAHIKTFRTSLSPFRIIFQPLCPLIPFLHIIIDINEFVYIILQSNV